MKRRFVGFTIFTASGEFLGFTEEGDWLCLLDLPEGPAFRDERGWIIPVYEED